jgi:type IV fimbrial biogenesis protein FimT
MMLITKHFKACRYQGGVTFVELMIVLAIAGVLASIALPSYRTFTVDSRVSRMTSILHVALHLARSEARKRGIPVFLCKSSNSDQAGAACDLSPSIDTANTGWAAGWIVYVDVNRSSTYDAGDTVISIQGQLLSAPALGSIVPNGGGEQIAFNGTGQAIGGVIFAVNAPPTSVSLSKAVCVLTGGQASIGKLPNCS